MVSDGEFINHKLYQKYRKLKYLNLIYQQNQSLYKPKYIDINSFKDIISFFVTFVIYTHRNILYCTELINYFKYAHLFILPYMYYIYIMMSIFQQI